MFAEPRLIIVLFVVLCFVRYIELARIPRDDGANQGPTSELAIGLQNFLDDISDKFNKIVVDDSLKKLFLDFGKSLEESDKAAEPASG